MTNAQRRSLERRLINDLKRFVGPSSQVSADQIETWYDKRLARQLKAEEKKENLFANPER